MNGIFHTTGKLLAGRLRDPDTDPLTGDHLGAGLLFAAVAGVGRYWDHPRAAAIMHTGLGSVGYVFVLAGFIWLLGLPLRIRPWSYRDLLTYISLTSPLAFLYALPVELWFPIETARMANLTFLLIVASWRVFLYARYLSRRVVLSVGGTFVMIVLPLSMIVNVLTFLNLDRVIVDFMSGIDDGGSGSGESYFWVGLISALSQLIWPFALIAYIVRSVSAWQSSRRNSSETAQQPPP